MVDWRCRRRYLTVYLAKKIEMEMGRGGKMRWLRIKWCASPKMKQLQRFLLGEQRDTDFRSETEAKANPSQAHTPLLVVTTVDGLHTTPVP